MSLRRALLLSIALHVLLLVIARPPQPLPQKAQERPLIARLLDPAPVEERPRLVEAVPALRKPARTARKAELRVPEEEASLVQPQVQPQQEARVEPAAEEMPKAVAPPPSPLLDTGEIAKYRLEIISAARQFRRYPPLARENSWQGRTEVRVSFDGARQPALIISKSSGHAVLDRQAVETLSKALAPLPPVLLGGSFELDFPVVFSLDD